VDSCDYRRGRAVDCHVHPDFEFAAMSDSSDRYHRQLLLKPIGSGGQARLGESHALIVGCGALGCAVADHLARSGVGRLTIVDRDVVELVNLHRQCLFDERDAAESAPKAEAARRRLDQINSSIQVDAHLADFNHTNAESFIDDADVIVDGLDNFQTRFLLNDLSVKHGLPYVYGGAVGTEGMTTTILPHRSGQSSNEKSNINVRTAWSDEQATPCLRCLFDAPPPPGVSPTCDTVGVLAPVVALVASIQATEVIKVLVGDYEAINRSLLAINPWENRFRAVDIPSSGRSADCPACSHGRYEYLNAQQADMTTSVCGRKAVQIVPAGSPVSSEENLRQVAERLKSIGTVTLTPFLLRAEIQDGGQAYDITLFTDGRAIVKGTDQPDVAKTIYARYVGS